MVLDTAGLISYANRRCFESGYREDELIGHRLVDWVEASHRDDFDAADRVLEIQDGAEVHDHRLAGPDGVVD